MKSPYKGVSEIQKKAPSMVPGAFKVKEEEEPGKRLRRKGW